MHAEAIPLALSLAATHALSICDSHIGFDGLVSSGLLVQSRDEVFPTRTLTEHSLAARETQPIILAKVALSRSHSEHNRCRSIPVIFHRGSCLKGEKSIIFVFIPHVVRRHFQVGTGFLALWIK